MVQIELHARVHTFTSAHPGSWIRGRTSGANSIYTCTSSQVHKGNYTEKIKYKNNVGYKMIISNEVRRDAL